MNVKEKIQELKDLQKRLPIAGMYDDKVDDIRFKIDDIILELENFEEKEELINDFIESIKPYISNQ